jgi:FkbM family methyltransferase
MTSIRKTGLSDAAGECVLHVPAYGGWVFDRLASLDAFCARDWLEREVFGFDPAKLRLDTFPCRVSTLDELDLAPSFIKVDVQGLESKVLIGGRQTLARHRPILLVEGIETGEPSLLAEIGYVSCRYHRRALYVGRRSDRSTFFLCPEHIDSLDRIKVAVH